MAEDQGRRLRQYLWQMGVRLVLIVAAVFVRDSWLFWVCIAGAVLLPYTAVIFANAGRDRSTHEVSAVPPTPPAELPASPTPRAEDHHRVVDHVADPSPGTPRAGAEQPDDDDTDRKDA